MMWLAIAALFPAVIWPASGTYRLTIEWVVCAGAAGALLQAFREKHYFMVYAFFLVAVVFNPVLPVSLSSGAFVWLAIGCTAAFLAGLAALGQPVIRHASDDASHTHPIGQRRGVNASGHLPSIEARESCQMMDGSRFAIAISSRRSRPLC